MTTLTRRQASVNISYSVEQGAPSWPAQNGAFVLPNLHWNATNTTNTSAGFDLLPLIAQASTSGMLATERGGAVADRHEVGNRRRVFLINKKCYSANGLSSAESAELDALQSHFEATLDAVRPLPTEILDDLKRLAEELESEEATP